MSEQTQGETQQKVVTMVSDRASFHITLLCKFISENVGPCTVITTQQNISSDTKLILLDCSQTPVETLNTVLRELSVTSNQCPTALFNAEAKEEHENLLDWPCISGLFYNDSSEAQLLHGIKELLEGDFWVPRRLLHHFFNKHRQSTNKGQVSPTSTIQLTNREKEILRMIKDGMSNSAVSESLDLSEHTVKSHLYNIYKKIGVRNRMEASNWARGQQGLDIL